MSTRISSTIALLALAGCGGRETTNQMLSAMEAGAAAHNDITTGSNPGCGTNGFPATTGWDPVSLRNGCLLLVRGKS